MRVLSRWFVCCLAMWLVACDDSTLPPPNPPSGGGRDVVVLNEGNFQRGNASLGVFNPITEQYTSKQFKALNNRPIGDVLQSAIIIEGNYWLVVNNSGNILVIDSASLLLKHVIDGFTSPRYAQYIPTSQKVWVSDLYANEISVVDPTNFTKVSAIPFSGWSEQMALVGNEVCVSAPNAPYVYWLQSSNGDVLDSTWVGYNVNAMTYHDNRVLALSAGRVGSKDTTAMVWLTADHEVEERLPLNNVKGARNLTVDPLSGNLYFLAQGIHYINPQTLQYEGRVLDMSDKESYGMSINPTNGNIYVSDVKDYVQPSTVYVYRKDFKLKTSFEAGILTNQFLFRN